MNSFYEGREPAEYFKEIAKRSGGVAREYRMESSEGTLMQMYEMVIGTVSKEEESEGQ